MGKRVEELEKHWKPWDLVKVPNSDYVSPSHHTIEKLENMFEKFHGDEHPEKFANFDLDFGADKPLDRWDTFLEDRFENWDSLHAQKTEYSDTSMKLPAQKTEYSDTSMKLPKIFSWKASGSFSWARSLGKSLLDFFR